MVRIYIPEVKGKKKTAARGFWKNPAGKIYYDYIAIQNYGGGLSNEFYRHIENLQKFYQQEAIFFVYNDTAYIYKNATDITELKHRFFVTVQKTKADIKKYCKKLLKVYGGFTVYIDKLSYAVEAWSV